MSACRPSGMIPQYNPGSGLFPLDSAMHTGYSRIGILRAMSSHARKERQTQTNTASPPTIGANSDDRLKRAKEAVHALQGSDDPPEHFRKVWQEFRQVYEDTVNHNCTDYDTYGAFPVWALSQFDVGDLEDFLTAGYSQDLKYLRICAASAPSHFRNRPWKFILYFDYIERQRARAINDILIKRPTLTFNGLYEEVQINRLKRIKNHKNPKYEFLPRDFKACRSQPPWHLLSD